MAYRRRQQGLSLKVNSTIEDQLPLDFEVDDGSLSSSSASSSSLAAKAMRASSAYKDTSLSSAYSSPAAYRVSTPSSASPTVKDPKPHEYTSMKNLGEPKQGFWGALASKAKAILDDDNKTQQYETPTRTSQLMASRASGSKVRESKSILEGDNTNQQTEMPEGTGKPMSATTSGAKYQNRDYSNESRWKMESPKIQKGIDAITSSLNFIGGNIGNAVEGGITIVENRTAGIIQGTRKHIRKQSSSSKTENEAGIQPQIPNQVQPKTQDLEIQLKASRDVSMAMAAKAKLLLRELKTVKADLAFAKQRCGQLEEENKVLRENRDRGDHPEDDDLVRLQLETLLAEKARLTHENSIYSRENRFLREVVEYHQLTMQDVVYLDESTEEVTEVYPINITAISESSPMSVSPSLTPDTTLHPTSSPGAELEDVSQSATSETIHSM